MKQVKLHSKFERLVFYNRHADEVYWNEHWSCLSTDDLLINNTLFNVLRLFLPSTGKLLEAGCGLSQYVKLFIDNDYDIVGVDFSKLAISKAKKFDRNLPIIIGDVLSLPYDDCSFSGCFSLGVVEHFENGPDAAIREIHRVLVDDGTLLISVPFFNQLRQLKATLGMYDVVTSKEAVFYQYAFTIPEFKKILQQCGFATSAVLFYDISSTVNNELSFVRRFCRLFEGSDQQAAEINQIREKPFMSTLINHSFVGRLLSHMMLFVAKKV